MDKNFFEKYSIWIVLGVCLLLFFYKLGSYNLIDVDEPRYAEAAREMLETSNWITPHFNYDVRFDKPVFFYWLIAFSYLIFGVGEFSARFPSAFLSTLMVFFIYFTGKRIISPGFGLVSSLILATSLEFLVIGRMSITDSTLGVLISSCILSGFLATVSKNKKLLWWLITCFLSGLAVLTKGPVGFVLPVGVLGVYLILTGQIKENLKLKFVIPGILIFLLTSVPWYYLVIKQNGMAFVDYFFLKHNLERFASKEFAQHQEPFYFYLIVFGAGFFPWTISFIASLPEMFQNLRNNVKFKDKKFNLAFFENSDNKFKYLLLSIVWFLVILSFFSASKAKLATYIMPLFPVAAIMTGYFWNKYLFENNNSKNINISVIIFALMCIIAGVGFIPAMHLTPALIKLFGKSNIPFYSLIIALCFIVIPSFMLLLLKKGMKKQVFGLKIVFITAVMLIWVHVGHNIYFKTGPCDLISYINYSKKISLPGDKFLPYGVNKPGMVFYSRHKINFLEKESELQEFLSQETPILVVIRNKTIPELSSGLKFNLIKSGIRYSLISNTNKEALEKFYADSE